MAARRHTDNGQVSREAVEEVLRLIAAGVSRRSVSDTTGISRTIVNKIANREILPEHRKPAGGVAVEPRIKFPSGRAARCPACRRLVQQPCLACQLEGAL